MTSTPGTAHVSPPDADRSRPPGDPDAAGGRAPSRRARPRWTLRRRLVVVVVALLAVVAAVMGLASTVALRSTLVEQIDDRLESASSRAAAAPGRLDGDRDDAFGGDEGAAPSDGSSPGTWPGGADDDVPPAFVLPGQAVGTVVLFQRADAAALQAGYLDDSGMIQPLTDAQAAALLDLTPDGTVDTVELPGLGQYRVIAVLTDRGDTSVTGLPLESVTATVDQYLVVELVVAAAALLLAAASATMLVRRELRPLDRVAATAVRVSEMPLSRGEVDIPERVPAQDTDPATEVGQVGAALNRMLGHVESALTARHESETQVRRFVADASHELRTPLASIRGYAELVQRLPGDLPDDAVRAMHRVESEAQRMTGLVEDMLLLARLDAGRDLDVTEVDLAELAVDAVADAHAAGPDHLWRLDLGDVGGADDADGREDTDDAGDGSGDAGHGSGDVGDGEDDEQPGTLVLGDEHRLRQVLVNLLSNARVHTPAGTTVVVSVAREGEDAVLRVRDDGPGIPEPLRSRLFERFARGDASRNRAAGSTGLGLAIVHAVVAAHGGTIDVDGTPGRTTFTVRLPGPGAHDAAGARDAAGPPSPTRTPGTR